MADDATAGAKNGFGVASLVLGFVGLIGGLLIPLVWLLSVAAIVLGALARKRVNRGEATNGTMALWGLWLGIIGTGLYVVLTLIVLYLTI